jgi:hypothetical protein
METPVIVPPTWSKAEHHARIEQVWREAARELSEARNIYVIGYSLPATDQFFRYLYAVGSIGDGRLRRFWVFDPEKEVHARFEALLGPGARGRFKPYEMTFEKAISEISRSV